MQQDEVEAASLARDWPESNSTALVEDGENKDWFKTHLDGQPILSVPHFEIIKAGSVLELPVRREEDRQH